MNPKLLLPFSIFCFLISGTVTAHVALDYPVGGEVFHPGDTVTIQWHNIVYHGTADFDLYFTNDGGASWQALAMNLPESQFEYDWTVPNTATSSGRIRVIQDNASGSDYSSSSGNFSINVSTGIDEPTNHTNSFKLYAAYPNPFNPTTTIEYSVPATGFVKLTIFNVIGEKIKTIVNEIKSAGRHKVIFDGSNLTNGVYFYRLEGENYSAFKKVTLLK